MTEIVETNGVPLSIDELQRILDSTIKYDNELKTMLFLMVLLTYTDEEQTNVFMTGETCSGKTYDIKEIMWYFPKEDILDYHGASPTSFFHSSDVIWVDGETFKPIDMSLRPKKGSEETGWVLWRETLAKSVMLRDLGRKIIVFYDMPHAKLLENLRGVLSHDKKICFYTITDRTERGSFRTKKVGIKGFFTCLFCTASTYMDDQEASRNFLLTPETSSEKVKACLDLDSRRNTDLHYKFWHETDLDRTFLKTHIETIKALEINQILLDESLETQLRIWFEKQLLYGYKPKDNRDMPRLRALAKGFALYNWQTRKLTYDPEPQEILDPEEDKQPTEKPEKILWCNQQDIDVAVKLYSSIIKSNELGLSPEAYEIWEKIVKPNLNENGFTVRDAHREYFKIFHRQANDKRLRDMLKLFPQKGLCTEISEGKGKPLKYLPISIEQTQLGVRND